MELVYVPVPRSIGRLGFRSGFGGKNARISYTWGQSRLQSAISRTRCADAARHSASRGCRESPGRVVWTGSGPWFYPDWAEPAALDSNSLRLHREESQEPFRRRQADGPGDRAQGLFDLCVELSRRKFFDE